MPHGRAMGPTVRAPVGYAPETIDFPMKIMFGFSVKSFPKKNNPMKGDIWIPNGWRI